MKPRTLKLNAHRTLTYYTPEDVAELQYQLGQADIHLKIGADALALVRSQRDAANKRVEALTAECQRLMDEIDELRKKDDDEVLW